MIFSKEEEARIVQSIRAAERRTSGEIRVFVEDFCDRDLPVERAAEIFHLYGMFNTKEQNGVLIYLAEKSHQFAIWGDAGIHERVGFQFWDAEKRLMREYLQRDGQRHDMLLYGLLSREWAARQTGQTSTSELS